MRAVIVEHRGQAGSLRELPDPSPGPREVLIAIHAIGLNPVDWKLRDLYDRPMPFILGQDFAGTIAALGSEVREEYRQGDRVFGIAREHGAYAELTVVSIDDPAQPVAKIPLSVGDADAAGLPTPGLTALACMQRIKPEAGQRMLIVGVMGSVGQLLAQMAREQGVVISGVGRAAQAQSAQDLGLTSYFAFDEPGRNIIDAMRESMPDGFDIVADLANDAEQIKELVPVVRKGGIIISTIHSLDDAKAFTDHAIRAENVNLDDLGSQTHHGLQQIAHLTEQGTLHVPIAAEHDFASALVALDSVKAGKTAGKVILTIDRGP